MKYHNEEYLARFADSPEAIEALGTFLAECYEYCCEDSPVYLAARDVEIALLGPTLLFEVVMTAGKIPPVVGNLEEAIDELCIFALDDEESAELVKPFRQRLAEALKDRGAYLGE